MGGSTGGPISGSSERCNPPPRGSTLRKNRVKVRVRARVTGWTPSVAGWARGAAGWTHGGSTSRVTRDGAPRTSGTRMVLPGARLSEDELHVPLGGGGTSPEMAPPTLLRRAPLPAAAPSSSKDSTPSSTSHAPGCVTAMVRQPFLRSVYPRMRSTSGHEADLSTDSESWSNCQPSLRTCKLRI
eukprot:scaffold28252_cov36-Phaeocystis_antarctica.AAC.1